jgi:hypothetical protein
MPHALDSPFRETATYTPEQVARQLFPGTGLAGRTRCSPGMLVRRRHAYLDGVRDCLDAFARLYYDEAERLTIPGRQYATSYDDVERAVFDWGWEDALGGRFAEVGT